MAADPPPKTTRHTSRKVAERLRKQLDGSLTNLTQAELIRLLASEEAEYIFKHALVRDSTYTMLLKQDRQALHLNVAHAVETIYAERCVDEYAALLAGHYAAAGDAIKTLEYATRAGDEAFRVYALTEATAFYRLAIDAASRLPETPSVTLIQLYRQRGQAYYSNTKWHEALNNYEEMEQSAHARSDRSLELWSLVERTVLRSNFSPLFNPQDALALAARALLLADQLGDRPARAKLLWALMTVHGITQDVELAIQYGTEALGLARELGLREQTAYVLGDLQYTYRLSGRFSDALAALQQVSETWRELGNLHMLADNLNQIAFIFLLMGDLPRTAQFTRQAAEVSQESSNVRQVSMSWFILAEIAHERGEMGDAFDALVSAQQGRDAFPIIPMVIYASSILSELGATRQTLALLRQTQELIANSDIATFFSDGVWSQIARLCVAQGEFAQAERALEATAPTRTPFDARILFGNIQSRRFVEAELSLAQGNAASAIEILEAIIAQYEPVGLFRPVPETYLLLARARVAQADFKAASEALVCGQQLAGRMGSRRFLWRILAALGEIALQQGDAKGADEFRARARAEIEFIAAHTPESFTYESISLNLRESFLNMPEVQIVMADNAQ